MKILHSTILALVIGVASVSAVSARESFSLGANISSFGYAPPVAYYSSPSVVYYSQPSVQYRTVSSVYYQPVISYGYYYDARRGYNRGCGHERREHHGWGHEGWSRGRGYGEHGHHEGRY